MLSVWKDKWSGFSQDLIAIVTKWPLTTSVIPRTCWKVPYAAPTAKPNVLVVKKDDTSIRVSWWYRWKNLQVVRNSASAKQLEAYNTEHADNPAIITIQGWFQQIMSRLSDGQFDYKILIKSVLKQGYQNQGLDNSKVIELPSDQQPYVAHFLLKVKDELKSLWTNVSKTLQDELLVSTVLRRHISQQKLILNSRMKSSSLEERMISSASEYIVSETILPI